MANGTWQGKDLEHPELRRLFSPEYVLRSDWYAARLKAKQAVDCKLWQRHVNYLERFLRRHTHAEEAERLGIPARLQYARTALNESESPAYLAKLNGTLGAEPIGPYCQSG
jgi:hypothetical protein